MNPTTPQALETKDPLVDDAMLLGGYALRAVRRRLALAIAIFMVTALSTLAFLALTSPLYDVETRIVVDDARVMKDLAQPARLTVPRDDAEEIAGAAELVTSRETLLYVVEKLDLPRLWNETRRPAGQLIDRAVGAVFGRASAAERREQIYEILQKRVSATAEAGLIRIAVQWHEPKTALAIAETLKNRFLEVRRQAELDQITDTHDILAKEAAEARLALVTAEEELKKAADDANALTARSLRKAQGEGLDLEAVARMQRQLTTTRDAIARQEAIFAARIAEAEARLNSTRAGLAASHPDVLEAQRNLALQSRTPTELTALRAEETRLAGELARAVPSLVAVQLFGAMAMVSGVEPNVEAALSNYRRAAEQFTRLRDRLETARLELDTAAASFAFRYVVTQPPVLPREPSRPNTPAVLIAGLLGGLFLAFVLSVLADVMSRRIQEPWQISRFLGVPVLGRLEEGA